MPFSHSNTERTYFYTQHKQRLLFLCVLHSKSKLCCELQRPLYFVFVYYYLQHRKQINNRAACLRMRARRTMRAVSTWKVLLLQSTSHRLQLPVQSTGVTQSPGLSSTSERSLANKQLYSDAIIYITHKQTGFFVCFGFRHKLVDGTLGSRLRPRCMGRWCHSGHRTACRAPRGCPPACGVALKGDVT